MFVHRPSESTNDFTLLNPLLVLVVQARLQNEKKVEGNKTNKKIRGKMPLNKSHERRNKLNYVSEFLSC